MNDTLLYALVGVGSFLLAKKKGGAAGGSSSGGSNATQALRQRILQVAAAEEALKVREASYNSDTGYRIDDYQAIFGMHGGMWCAAFVSWCVMTALGRKRPPRWCSASTSALMARVRDAYRDGRLPAEFVAFAREPETLSRIKEGWVYIKGTTANGSDPLEAPAGGWKTGHTGIVVSPQAAKAGHFRTVEGNTCVGSGCNGGGVFYADRPYAKNNNVIWFDPIAMTMIEEKNALG